MGALDSPEAHAVEYLGNNELLVRHVNGSVRRQDMSIFQYLSEALAAHEAPVVQIDGSVDRPMPFDITEAWFGYLGYETRHDAQAVFTAPRAPDGGFDYTASAQAQTHKVSQPLALLLFPTTYVVYDHANCDAYIVSSGPDAESARALAAEIKQRLEVVLSQRLSPRPPRAPLLPSTLTAWKTEQEYHDDIDECLEQIRRGETYEVCLTVQFHGPCEAAPLDIYDTLRRRNPAPYASYIRYDPLAMSPSSSVPHWYRSGGIAILSSSPERYLKASKEGMIESKPIKGTARRDLTDISKDQEIAQHLKHDEKSRAENLMIVDLVRNDFGRVCEMGTVTVPNIMDVETYASVHQLVSTIQGVLRPKSSIIDAIIATFPGGSMTGAPKLRTMDIIDSIEGRPRGVYSGAIGYIGKNNVADLSIVIRTAVLLGDDITVSAGGAIIALSDANKVNSIQLIFTCVKLTTLIGSR